MATRGARHVGGDYLRAVERYVPVSLVSRESLKALAAVADQVPVPESVLIECPLDDAPTAADLSLSFARPRIDGDAPLTADALPRGAAWDPLRRFVAAWTQPTGPLWNEVNTLWLEFDVRRVLATPTDAHPNLFFGHEHRPLSPSAIDAGLDAIVGAGITPLRERSRRCVEILPRGAGILFVGVMLARQPAAVRYCADISREQRWPTALDASARHLLGHARHAVVQVEAGSDPVAKLGFELYQGRTHRARPDVWQPLLELLVREGVASRDRCDAALTWPGAAYDERLGPRVIARWINHVKVTYDGNALVEAKIYLQCGTAWDPRESDAGDAGTA